MNPTRLEVKEFHNYAAQDGKEHKAADVRPVWLNSGSLKSSNPVWQSARLIKLSFSGAAWSEVEKILQDEIFKLASPSLAATGGDPTCWPI
jgi:hypothetical protein